MHTDPQKKKAFKETYRVLKKSGLFTAFSYRGTAAQSAS
jgi:ubiquinone/menaquinone biosynthesis C-methylase UbiE